MSSLARTPGLRWLVPLLAAVVLLAGSWASGRFAASAQDGLTPLSAQRLLVALQQAHVPGLSGTVVEHADLGLPSLPGSGDSADFSSLVSGTHTMRVWLSGRDKERIALMGHLGESDVVRQGRDLWTWSSHDQQATHRTLAAAGKQPQAQRAHAEMPHTPQQVAEQVLGAVRPSTRVTTTGTAVVAGRRAYELVLQPRQPASLVDQVRIAVDGRTHVPLRVQVLSRRTHSPAFEIGFTSFDPTRPDPARFRFTPPPGAEVADHGSAAPDAHGLGRLAGDLPLPTLVGRGWAGVLVARLPQHGSGTQQPGTPSQQGRLLRQLPRVSGSWGSGHLLAGSLFSAVLTDDGRVAFGAVRPERLYRALAAR